MMCQSGARATSQGIKEIFKSQWWAQIVDI